MSGIVHIHHKNRSALYDEYNISPATLNGNILLMSGLVGFRRDGSVADSLEEQIELIFEQAKDILEEAGGDFSNIASFDTYHTGEVAIFAQMEAFMSVRDRYVQRPGPAWTSLGVNGLAIPGAAIEVKITAYI
ncbi:Rid family hydrolase [Paraburkholderia sediminicola]|uniref:Rid family hydrolase n=1 Tax=Paraburkholderia sediminicola TaxID=458836 RepID=UPI0038BC72A2